MATVTIKNMPDDLRSILEKRAAAVEQCLTDDVREQLIRIAKHSANDVDARRSNRPD